jgi:dihydrofolate synthase/folylpolyglutamate synthase
VAKEQGSQILRPQAQAFENLSLAGEHQQANAATALAALNYLKAHGFDRLEDMEQSFSQARWPARLQQLTQGPLPEMLPPQATLWLDSGHNGPAAQQLARWIQAQDMPLHLIFSMSQGHDVAEFLTPMLPYLASCHVIEIPDEPLSQPLCALDAAARGVCASVQSHQNIEDAVRATVSRISGDYGIIITGSLYLAGKVLEKNS